MFSLVNCSCGTMTCYVTMVLHPLILWGEKIQYLPVASALIVGGLTFATFSLNQGLDAHPHHSSTSFLSVLFFPSVLHYRQLCIALIFYCAIFFPCSWAKCTAFCFFSGLGWLDSWCNGHSESKWEAVLLQASFVWSAVNY